MKRIAILVAACLAAGIGVWTWQSSSPELGLRDGERPVTSDRDRGVTAESVSDAGRREDVEGPGARAAVSRPYGASFRDALVLVRGKVVADAGIAGLDLRVDARASAVWTKIPRANHRAARTSVQENGDFEFRIWPGRYTLRIGRETSRRSDALRSFAVVVHEAAYELSGGPEIDLGTIEIATGAGLRGRLAMQGASAPRDVELALWPMDAHGSLDADRALRCECIVPEFKPKGWRLWPYPSRGIRIPVADDGSFEARGFPAGAYSLSFGGRRKEVLRVRLTPGEVRDVGALRVPATRRFRGRVVDTDGQPVRSVEVWCFDPDPKYEAHVARSVGRTDDAGSFEVQTPLQRCSFALRLDDDAHWHVEEVALRDGFELKVERGHALTIEVVSAAGDAESPQIVLWKLPAYPKHFDDRRRVERPIAAIAPHRWRWRGLASGNYLVEVHTKSSIGHARVQVDGPCSAQVELHARAQPLRVRVVDASTKEAIQDVIVTLLGRSKTPIKSGALVRSNTTVLARARTDVRGQAELAMGIPEVVRVRLEHPGYATLERRCDSSTRDLTFELRAPALLTVQVETPQITLLRDASVAVRAEPADALTPKVRKLDTRGRTVFVVHKPCKVELSLRKDRRSTVECTLVDGRPPHVVVEGTTRVVLKPKSIQTYPGIRGRLRVPPPVAGGTVAYVVKSPGNRDVQIGTDGDFEVGPFTKAAVRVQVVRKCDGQEDVTIFNEPVALAADRLVDLEVRVEAASLEGRVFGADGQPLANAYLMLLRDGRPRCRAYTDKSGRFSFPFCVVETSTLQVLKLTRDKGLTANTKREIEFRPGKREYLEIRLQRTVALQISLLPSGDEKLPAGAYPVLHFRSKSEEISVQIVRGVAKRNAFPRGDFTVELRGLNCRDFELTPTSRRLVVVDAASAKRTLSYQPRAKK